MYTNDIIILKIIKKERGRMTDREILLSLYNDMHVVKDCMTSLENRVTNLEDSMTELKNDVSELKSDVTELKEDVMVLKKDVSDLKEDVTELKEDVSELKNDVTVLKNDVAVLKNDVTNINITLENETNRNIHIIAEGHSDLSRKFDEALKHEQQYHEERELLIVRVNSIENDVRKIKEKVAM